MKIYRIDIEPGWIIDNVIIVPVWNSTQQRLRFSFRQILPSDTYVSLATPTTCTVAGVELRDIPDGMLSYDVTVVGYLFSFPIRPELTLASFQFP